ncbi:GNAT family N-acetyltransferase [Clostridium estertheticum]|uniref:GNAT family acetyltransferase n=1 Tax=Clostridium estertheticum subsp. estertheticum TaxID=1552 RepID=A0A1J0GBD0_9CLOT|nr:GNAT family protein [Clostridium estertheticum]APC38660.1 GNAT family acetyltransferase [Clostridium estertheticum subsp. estertheticum]MBW9174012.1 GNAT family N-acetyltransferase [Clostridium estertheticum]MBZ9615493.1 GNAT family N-acetyltransferase [Clostridium estertheticum subsp. laramiense]MCB2343344.1 GNAT family N-acetyltransferase [Clostridium estertheticum]WAG75373.1 GNAT family N-acetyltransferase [Clostridium estertheticum]
MNKGKYVNLEALKGNEREYIIKDNNYIILGRIFIVELDKENKFCQFRIKFHKHTNGSYEYLKDTLNLMLNILFKNMGINKVDVIADENINVSAFTDLGFELEGIITDSVVNKSDYQSEVMFGINAFRFNKNSIRRDLDIKGRNISIRALTPGDAQEVLGFHLRNRKYLSCFEPVRDETFYTLDNQKRTLTEGYKQFLNGSGVNFGIYKAKKLIGKIRISNIVIGVFKNAFIGYSMDEEEQNKGYMKEAVKLAVTYAFEELELHRVEASTLINNEKSQRVLKNCGFKELGISEKYLYINGEWRDHMVFYKVKNI